VRISDAVPASDGTVSGTVTNFGWVLSPNPRHADPPGGGTVQVVVDGAFLSAVPSGWTSRADLTALFPAAQFPGIGTALGVAGFDSTGLANGVHTISWVVTDNLGSASGIGSRYFTVSNGAGLTVAPSLASSVRTASAVRSISALEGRRGFNLDALFRLYPSDADGVITIQAEELDRIELRTRATAGYLRTALGPHPLPIGSRLDAASGVFTWQPGVAFVGPYDVVFDTPEGERNVRIVLNPKGSNRVGPQVVIRYANFAA
jgi:hypothetical protein